MPQRAYGFVMNILAVIRYGILEKPSCASLIKSSPFISWHFFVIMHAVSHISNRVDIPDLWYKFVWVGSGHIACCWQLPDRFRPEHISEDDKKRLEQFQKFQEGLEPTDFYVYSKGQNEPKCLQNFTIPEHILAQSMFRIVAKFDADPVRMIKTLLTQEEFEKIRVQLEVS